MANQREAQVQLLHRNVQWFRGGLVFKAHRLCVSLYSRLESTKEEEQQEDAQVREAFYLCLARVHGSCSRRICTKTQGIDLRSHHFDETESREIGLGLAEACMLWGYNPV